MRHLCILGSTGSIGLNTLQVIRDHRERFKVIALTAHSNIEVLAGQCLEFQPAIAVVGTESGATQLRALIASNCPKTEVLWGPQSLELVASHPQVDTVMAAIVGAAGLLSTLAAAKKGKRILLANKEALVMAGDLFMSEVKKNQVELLPIDSEHNAIYQCLPDANLANAQYRAEYHKHGVVEILLTASGGPFREWPLDRFEHITAEQACAHPNWVMGRKISVDSATMMNKGLEVIEAHYLFGLEPSRIQVLIHPQSLIHSMVRYNDGSVLAQLGQPDMKTPIAYGLAWPNRIDSGVKPLDFARIADLQFQALDHARYPCLNLAYQAMQMRGTMPTILNAANEVAVDQFLSGRIRFTDIYHIVSHVMEAIAPKQAVHLDDILESDRQAREAAVQSIKKMGR